MSVPAENGRSWREKSAGPLVISAIAYSIAIAVAAYTIVEFANPSPLWSALVGDVAATLVIFVVGWALSNSSIYDPYWSLAPPILMLFWMLHPDGNAGLPLRELVLFALLVLYAARLTFNCFRRWENMNHEDFRYQNFRKQFGAFYPVIDLLGIQLVPTFMVFAGCLAVFAVTRTDTAPGLLDLAAFVVTLGAIIFEAVADQQLEAFKRSDHQPGGMCREGLWAWSQHPNYFGELGFWWGLWLFAMAADPASWWTIVGPIAMTILFAGVSIPMMVKRKRLSRPNYDEMVAGISLVIPWPPRRQP